MNPGDAQLRAQSELQSGESLYWTSTADPRRLALSALPASIFGIPFAGFALFWITQAYHATSAMSRSSHNAFVSGFKVFPLFGLPFLLIGLGVILAPLWAFLKGGNTVYAVTNQRVMIITGSGNRSVKSYTPADIVSIEHRERPDGSGDIVITTNAFARSNNNLASPIKVALCGIPNVKQVLQQVMQLHTQRPAT
jgi:Bacterial PH domain